MYQPPPPPHPNFDPNLSFGSLNVSDPRYAAKYGNPYLRTMPPEVVSNSPQVAPRSYPYATMSPRGYAHQQGPPSPNMAGFSSVQRSKKGGNPVNYSGTMVGNGKATVAPTNGKVSNGGSQYIVSPETDMKADAMATHV